jgi:peptide/nickel transport system permease protein
MLEQSVFVQADPIVVELESSEVAAPVGPVRHRRKFGPAFWLPVAWLGLVLFFAIFAGVLPFVQSPLKITGQTNLMPFHQGHIVGTDYLGRDTLARLAFGARVSLTVGIVAVGIGMAIGGLLGLLAGFYRGRVETIVMFFVDALLAFPALILVLAITVFLGQSLRNVTLAIAVVAIPAFARVTRAATLTFSEREFVTAARGMGATNLRIVLREVLPNVAIPVASFALVVVAVAIVAEGGLAFLGQSVPHPQPSWGGMIAEGKAVLQDRSAPQDALIPAGVMFFTVLSINLVGDRLRKVLNVREAAI